MKVTNKLVNNGLVAWGPLNRKEELYASCAVLGIPEQNVILLKHSKLKDDPSIRYLFTPNTSVNYSFRFCNYI